MHPGCFSLFITISLDDRIALILFASCTDTSGKDQHTFCIKFSLQVYVNLVVKCH